MLAFDSFTLASIYTLIQLYVYVTRLGTRALGIGTSRQTYCTDKINTDSENNDIRVTKKSVIVVFRISVNLICTSVKLMGTELFEDQSEVV